MRIKTATPLSSFYRCKISAVESRRINSAVSL